MTVLVMPPRVARLPRDRHGYPVPWFVAFIDGVPDFRVIGPGKLREAVRYGRCWICGQSRGAYSAFVIGPMCAVNRVSAEPPSHRECAVYAALACPFLTTPNMVRRERRLPEGHVEPAGVMIKRNPGVALVWVTKRWKPVRVGGDGVLFHIGDPTETLWFTEGRGATRAEVAASMDSGLPLLQESAAADGPEAVAELKRMYGQAQALLPR